MPSTPAKKSPKKASTKAKAATKAKAPAKAKAPPKAKAEAKAKAKAPAKGAAKGAAKAKASAGADWRPAVLERMRALIFEADPAIVEEVKWRKPSNPDGVPVWSRDGILCVGGLFKGYVKLTFAEGAHLPDPAKLFNAGFAGNRNRAIDIHEGETVDAAAFRQLVRDAVALNVGRKAERAKN